MCVRVCVRRESLLSLWCDASLTICFSFSILDIFRLFRHHFKHTRGGAIICYFVSMSPVVPWFSFISNKPSHCMYQDTLRGRGRMNNIIYFRPIRLVVGLKKNKNRNGERLNNWALLLASSQTAFCC